MRFAHAPADVRSPNSVGHCLPSSSELQPALASSFLVVLLKGEGCHVSQHSGAVPATPLNDTASNPAAVSLVARRGFQALGCRAKGALPGKL